MKTSVTMKRKMGIFDVFQRTSDGMFNATELLKQWNLNTQNYGDLKKKDMDDYLSIKSTKEFINTIMNEENLHTTKMVYLSSRGKYNGGTWMHPLLFIDFAMWINPTFKYAALKFVYDQMIKYRNEAGDAYRELGSSVQKIVPRNSMKKDMKKIGEALNWVIFNNHTQGMRNKVGEEKKQRELYELEHKVSDLINDGFIRSYEQIICYLRVQYSKRNYPAIFK